ncbi:hypothetical protein ARC20_04605 [Stenotrophomonas panacihumi]|uniref:Biotin carboxylase n=1 Tax=Stenotrophomonas panacihumi TaxID=676599 RepID=A0A0R0ANJ8_9GAMM|nr:DUF3182 family protein [Stenotrophomonas panacihumi]KRG46725.1 hypothetical protein ARC20_04605 [Stenotrophomonas panacihumi]PTN54587.1 DUF3182 domain-containing protein [Stenotrophomonas panacihumi]
MALSAGGRALVRVHALRIRDTPEGGHERATHDWVARRVAQLLRLPYAGVARDAQGVAEGAYFVPDDTLDAPTASRLGIADRGDLLGGVVPHAFLATKVIAHALVDSPAATIAGWNAAAARVLAAHALPGYTAFSAADARRAHELLAREGGVRLKLPTGVGGRGQWLIEDAPMLDVLLAQLPEGYLARHGVVLEMHLARLATFSVGEVEFGGQSIAYHGTQSTTRARDGHEVYGGSDLEVVRGTLEALLEAPLPPLQRQAVVAAHAFDRALRQAWPQLHLSRRNYDVACGEDVHGRPRCGVLEQSWRVGGATPAELAAMTAFARDPALARVRAATRELHGQRAPSGAEVYYDAEDPELGPLVKYVTVSDA